MTELPLVRRAVGIWLTLVAVESLHGLMRRLLLEPQLGDLLARQVSVLTGAMLIILVFWFTLRRLGSQPRRRWWEVGFLWLTLTLAFEIGLGRATGMSWGRITSDFDLQRGGFLGLGMLVILVAPRLLAERLGLIEGGQRTPNLRMSRGREKSQCGYSSSAEPAASVASSSKRR